MRSAAERAIHVWEAESGRRLFVYDKNRGFPVDLVFDARQEARSARRNGGGNLGASKAALDRAQRSAREAKERFNRSEERIDAETDAYDSRLDAYNRRVDYWNDAGGAPRDTAARLVDEKARLASERSHLVRDRQDSEAMLEDANNRVDAYNDSLAHYNFEVREFNYRFSAPMRERIGDCLMSGVRARRISVYAFEDLNELTAVLTHEFGHALGLRHVKGDGALMSAVENGEGVGNDILLTARDKAELRRALRR